MVWHLVWSFRHLDMVKDLLHSGQLYKLLWICMWICRLPFVLNELSHSWQESVLSVSPSIVAGGLFQSFFRSFAFIAFISVNLLFGKRYGLFCVSFLCVVSVLFQYHNYSCTRHNWTVFFLCVTHLSYFVVHQGSGLFCDSFLCVTSFLFQNHFSSCTCHNWCVFFLCVSSVPF